MRAHAADAPQSRPRWQHLGARAVAGVVSVVLATSSPALADSFDDQRRDAQERAAEQERRSAELEESIEGMSADLAQAVLDLESTKALLPAAEEALRVADEEVQRTQREADMLGTRLDDARDQEQQLATEFDADTERADELRATVGELARSAYRDGGSLGTLGVVLDAESSREFVDRYSLVETALRTQARALEDLNTLRASNEQSKARLTAVRDRVSELKDAADAKAEEAAAARAVAAEQQAELERLLAEQDTRRQALAGMRAQAEAEQAQVDANRAAIESELAGIAAAERAAATARAAAEAEAARLKAEADAAKGQAPGAPAHPAPAPAPPPTTNGGGAFFSNPTSIRPMYVTSEYGMRLHPILGYTRLHAGIDLRTYCNTPLYAPRDGTIQWAQWRNGFGNQVMINYGVVDGKSMMSSSNHLTRSVVTAGQRVKRGDLIGYSGNTGLSGACHLHFEVYVNGSTVNPRPLLGL